MLSTCYSSSYYWHGPPPRPPRCRGKHRRCSMEIRTIGIDLGKTVFHFVGVNARGQVVVRKKAPGLSCCALRRTFASA